MKIKCSGCGRILQVPDSAAGKVAKCVCGKQLRVPGAAPTPVAAGGAAPSGARPAPRPSGVASGGFEADLFDELTDADLQPIGGPTSAAVPGAGKALKAYAPPGEVSDGGEKSGKRPGFLTFLGVINAVWAVIYFLGVLAMFGVAALALGVLGPGEISGEDGTVLALAAGALIFATVLSVLTAVGCFIGKQPFWYLILFSYAFSVGERIVTLAGGIVNGGDGAVIAGACVGVGIGLLFLAALHGNDVRAFYRIGKLTVGKAIGPNLLGLALGAGITAAVEFMA